MKLPHFARRGFGLIPLLVLIGMAAAATVLVVKQPWKTLPASQKADIRRQQRCWW
ncbi:MAG: hypothetical protein Q7V00_01450 [Sulfurimicrobium sp.]|nr:hypothetical protein [Sulfurimicrobium sp.]MDP1703196.1 hypothetical protein [Sulfurimicrobium sp.]MDP2198765.1 hypothetical protein [Sulfurimicrobium sp.]